MRETHIIHHQKVNTTTLNVKKTRVAVTASRMIFRPSALLGLCLLGSSAAFLTPRMPSVRSASHSTSLQSDYLNSLSGAPIAVPSQGESVTVATAPAPFFSSPPPPIVNGGAPAHDKFLHAPLDYFAIPNLQPKGPRANADVGQPHDASLKLGEDGNIRSGSWWCAAGGWPSLKQRDTTVRVRVEMMASMQNI